CREPDLRGRIPIDDRRPLQALEAVPAALDLGIGETYLMLPATPTAHGSTAAREAAAAARAGCSCDVLRGSGTEVDGSLATKRTEHSARSRSSAGTSPKKSWSPGRGLTPITRRL